MTSVALALICVIGLSSCASINVDKLPQPGNSYGEGYDLVIEFANTLNLPARAKVVMNGTTVGVVDRVTLRSDRVDVVARIDGAVEVPADTRAVLQQATVLGDIFVALDPAPGSATAARHLEPGGRIPLEQTTSPDQLEDTIASLSNFIGSGSIQRLQTTVLGINRITPETREQIRAITSRMSADLADLSTNVDTVDLLINGMSDTAQVMADRTDQLQYWFSPVGMRSFDRGSATATYLSTLLPSIGSVYNGGYWLVPLLRSLGYAAGAVQKSKWAIEGEYRPWRELFTDVFLPQDKYPAMNITSVQTPDGRDITNNVDEVLRMLGAVP